MRFKNRTTLNLHDLTNVYKTPGTNANTLSIRYSGLNFDGLVPQGIEDALLPGRFPILADTTSPDYLQAVHYPDTLLVVPAGRENERILEDVLRRIRFRPGMPVDTFKDLALNHLHRDRGYSLESRIPDGDADTLLRWLDSSQPGHCELYAGAFVLISRYAGYPSRLVTGFAGGDWNGFENYYMVRNRNAHAWCEIFDPMRGWIRVDPTPGNEEMETSVNAAIARGSILPDKTWKAYVDSLRILWFRRVIQFDGQDQLEMAESVKDVGLVSFEWFRERFNQMKNRFKMDVEAVRLEGSWGRLILDLLIPVVIIAALVGLLILLRRYRVRRNYEVIMRRRAGRLLAQLPETLLAKSGLMPAIQLIRFGPMGSWPDEPVKYLKSAVKAARRG
jgi:hypothetical protein